MIALRNVYITAAGAHLPGPPVNNEQIEEILGLVGGKGSRLKKRILAQNGILTRHYALDREGRTTHLNEELAAFAIQQALSRRGLPLTAVEMLAVGTTQGDLPVPGFASMVHGRLGGGPMEVLSAGGVCCSGMAALAGVARAIATGQRDVGVACGSELVSRMLKASRFAEEGTLEGRGSDDEAPAGTAQGSFRMFDADFLRWMLSDGAGALVVEPTPAPTGLSLRIEWVDVVSHAHSHPVCMYVGLADKDTPRAGNSWLDQPTIADADRTGMMKVRQDTRLLPQIVRLGVEEYLRHIRAGRIDPTAIDHVLCHYSSHFFKGEVMKLLAEAGVVVPEEKWFTNLYTKGNTGAASIYIMLEEALTSGRFKKGEHIVLMVPESGRFSVAFALLTVVDSSDAATSSPSSTSASSTLNPSLQERRWSATPNVARARAVRDEASIQSAVLHSPLGADFASDDDAMVRHLAVELGLVWADFERMLEATPILTRLRDGVFTLDDYKRLLVNLRQQVMEGARWIARAASNVSIELFSLRSIFIQHAGEEHRDFQILERDYVAVGGDLKDIQRQPKNVGSEALSSFMFDHASQPDPLDLLGAMFVIEGLGATKARQWATALQEQLKLKDDQVRFLGYHGGNDDRHFDKLRDVVKSGLIDATMAARIIKTARVTARLYALQLEELDHV